MIEHYCTEYCPSICPMFVWFITFDQRFDPPIMSAAAPVEAVMATRTPCLVSSCIRNWTRKDFPVPAAPVMKTLGRFWRSITTSAICRCSRLGSLYSRLELLEFRSTHLCCCDLTSCRTDRVGEANLSCRMHSFHRWSQRFTNHPAPLRPLSSIFLAGGSFCSTDRIFVLPSRHKEEWILADSPPSNHSAGRPSKMSSRGLSTVSE